MAISWVFPPRPQRLLPDSFPAITFAFRSVRLFFVSFSTRDQEHHVCFPSHLRPQSLLLEPFTTTKSPSLSLFDRFPITAVPFHPERPERPLYDSFPSSFRSKGPLFVPFRRLIGRETDPGSPWMAPPMPIPIQASFL